MMDEVREEPAAFVGLDAPFEGRGKFRSIAGVGPVYEVVQELGDVVRVRAVDEDDTFDIPRADALLDPPA
jgi:hypothetical protein